MSRRQLPRTRANFPRMKDRAAGRRARRHRGGSYTGGYRCPEHGIKWDWTDVSQAEQDEIDRDIADHEAMHDDYDLTDEEGGWICEHTRPELWAEGRALVAAIHERKRLAVGIDPGDPSGAIIFDRATGKILD